MKPQTQVICPVGFIGLEKGASTADIEQALAAGRFFCRVNGGEWEETPNLVPLEGRTHLLAVSLGASPKAAGYYVALYGGAITPAENWAAENFAAVAGEIISSSPGYVEPTRPQWVPGQARDGVIDSLASPARFTFAAPGGATLEVNGCALLSAEGKGSTTGVLIAASRFAAPRVFQDTDTFDVGYRIALTAG